MNKKILIVMICGIFSLESYASEYKYGYYMTQFNESPLNYIHKVTLQHNTNRCVSVYLSTKVGYLQDDLTCQYQEETDRMKNEYHICTTETSKLDGDKLSEFVKSGYNCAASLASDDLGQGIGIDEYHLFSDNGKYTRTEPAQGVINIP